jgi:DMSO/TMAO reductase YedYZ heme-binding membrane subunit
MKSYIALIKFSQEILLATSVIILSTIPAILAITPQWLTETSYLWLYGIAHVALFLVMLIRPLADIFRGNTWLRPLVILRKGMGVLSASIIVSFILSKVIIDGWSYFGTMFTGAYWSLLDLTLFAHLGDLSAIVLLITSNNLSKRLLGKHWKRIQRLSYVYFYASSFFVLFILHESVILFYMTAVTLATLFAWLRNRREILKTNPILA